jgi:hypothetical protein
MVEMFNSRLFPSPRFGCHAASTIHLLSTQTATRTGSASSSMPSVRCWQNTMGTAALKCRGIFRPRRKFPSFCGDRPCRHGGVNIHLLLCFSPLVPALDITNLKPSPTSFSSQLTTRLLSLTFVVISLFAKDQVTDCCLGSTLFGVSFPTGLSATMQETIRKASPSLSMYHPSPSGNVHRRLWGYDSS